MQNTQSNLMTLQQQIASGIALTSAGDNPSAFGQMSQLQQTQDTHARTLSKIEDQQAATIKSLQELQIGLARLETLLQTNAGTA